MSDFCPIVMAEEYWKESPFSIAKYYGQVNINGHTYTIVDKHGTDIFTLSRRASLLGKDKAIEPGEPCDLVREDWIPLYKAVGRDRLLDILDHTSDLDRACQLAGLENPIKPKKRKRTTKRKSQ